MNPYFIYLIEASICLTTLFLFYKLLLSKLTFYQLRRFYLIFSVLVSFTIPLIDIDMNEFDSPVVIQQYQDYKTEFTSIPTESKETNPVNKLSKNENQAVHKPASSDSQLVDLFTWIYLLGAAFMLIKFLIGFIKMIRLASNSQTSNHKNVRIHSHSSTPAAFSFFNLIFINPGELNTEKDLSIAIAHERVHMNELHSFDLFFIELVKVVLWFNPVLFFINKEIRCVHEFIADWKSTRDNDKAYYSKMLIRHAKSDSYNGLVHSLAIMPLKYRVKELFRKKSTGISKMRLLFSLPLLAGLLFVFSCSNEFDPSNSLFLNVKKIKSIKVIYHDEYGDMPQYDGKYYSWAKYDIAGNLIDLKKGSFQEKEYNRLAFFLRDQNYAYIQKNKIIWYLDYHNYDNQTDLLFEDPQIYIFQKMKNALEFGRGFYESDIIKNTQGLPTEIITQFPFDGKPRSTNIQIIKESFDYDFQGKLIEISYLSTSNVDKKTFRRSTSIEYNPYGKVSKINADGTIYQLYYDQFNNISEIIIGKENEIRYTYSYDESGIRTRSQTFNPNGELEYTLDYEYEYY